MRWLAVGAAGLAVAFSVGRAQADPCAPAAPGAPVTWGAKPAPPRATDESSFFAGAPPSARARDLLARAKLLDETATAEEKAAIELAGRLPPLRASAKTARDRADRASGDDREALVSRAEDLEADVAVTEAEAASKRRSAADNRRVARELRGRAVRLVRDAPDDDATPAGCDPPYRIGPDGRRHYRIECLK